MSYKFYPKKEKKVNQEQKIVQCESIEVKLYIAGDIMTADRIIRAYCKEVGLCVNVTGTKYIYSGGAEDGIIVGFINYPRFPDTLEGISEKALELGMLLVDGLSQWSFTIVGPYTSKFYSNRASK